MTVTSFWNAAYFWTGSPDFKQAEADIRKHGLDALPETSPARWFRWSAGRKSGHTKPADDKPNTNWCSDWVYDPDVNASYYGVWGCTATSTSFWTILRAVLSSTPPVTRPVSRSTWCPC